MTAYQTGQRFGAVLVFYVHTPRRTRYKADLSEKRVHIFGSRNAIFLVPQNPLRKYQFSHSEPNEEAI